MVPCLRNNRSAHLDYLRHLKESVEIIRDIVEEAKVVRPLDRSIVSACRYIKELLEYAIGTCPQGSQPHAKQLAHIPLIRKKQVIVAQPFNKLDSTTHLHVVTVTSQKTNVPVPPSTGVNCCSIASRSQPKSHVKPNRISPAKDKMADVNVPSGQTPIMAPPVRADDQMLSHIRFHPRPDSPLHLSNEEPVLGYLKFSAKGTKREIFGMPIPGRLITVDIREASYYQEYQENMAKHRGFLAGETGSTKDLPAPKLAKPARKPQSTTQKAPPKPSISSSATETADKPTKAKRIKRSISHEDADYQNAMEEIMKDAYALPKGPFPPVVIREPKSGKHQPLLEVPGKGKAKVTEEQVAHDLLNSEEESKKIVLGAEKGGQDEGQAGPDPDAQAEDQTGSDAGAQAKGQAGSNPDETFKGQAGSNPDETSEGQAGLDPNVTIQQALSLISLMTSPIIDLTSRPESPKQHQQLKATTTDTTTTTTTTAPRASGSQVTPPLPPPTSTNQDSPSKGSATPSPSKTAATTEHQAWTTPDVTLKPLISLTPADLDMDEAMGPDEPAQLSNEEDIRSAHILTLKPQDLEGPAYEIVKVFHPDVIHLQYQMEECHKLLTDSMDDLILRHNDNKPLPLGGPPGQVTIQSDFFFNKDLEYLRYGSKGRRPALSISKIKAAYYPNAGIEQMVPDQFWIEEECKYNIAAMYSISHWWFQRQRFYIDRHTSEGDRSTRVEDFQLGIESYQTQDKYRVQMMMRFNEIHKFSDGTLQQIVEALDYRVKEFRINRLNLGLNTRFWTRKDVDRCNAFMFAIQRRLRTRRIFRNLKSFVGGRVREGDYRLLKRTN
nr:histone deacetylase 14 [Tanacetum cinerariifolium]